jgi:hypothetical protein
MGLLAFGAMAGPLARATARANGMADGRGTPQAALTFVVVAAAEGRFLGWPANHGLWQWENGRELLVGFADGPWAKKEAGHQIGEPQHNRLARSMDGGRSWVRESPDPFVGTEADRDPVVTPASILFDHPDLALRVVAGSRRKGLDRIGRFFVSLDRGRHWKGPFLFAGLDEDPRLEGLVTTSRTSYFVNGSGALLVLMSAMDPRLGKVANRLDKPFVAASEDGGRRFRFLSWVVPWQDPFRAVMPSSVRLPSGELRTALRRRDPRGEASANWVDLFASGDGGRSWSWLSRVGETGLHNGNPPALTLLRDGRLACAYGNRTHRQMLLRTSADGGRSWSEERLIRANPFSSDLGYPQLVQNHRGELVVIYYLATEERPHSYIEAALLRP